MRVGVGEGGQEVLAGGCIGVIFCSGTFGGTPQGTFC